MTVGILTLSLFFPQSESLKDKRAILLKLRAKLTKKFGVCLAEIELQEKWQRSILAAGFISNDRRVIDGVFSKVVNFMSNSLEYNLVEYHQELI